MFDSSARDLQNDILPEEEFYCGESGPSTSLLYVAVLAGVGLVTVGFLVGRILPAL